MVAEDNYLEMSICSTQMDAEDECGGPIMASQGVVICAAYSSLESKSITTLYFLWSPWTLNTCEIAFCVRTVLLASHPCYNSTTFVHH